MSRVQLALRVADLDGSIAFYRSLFGVEPAKRRPGYANFAVADPPLKLVLIEGEAGRSTAMDHLGVEVETTEEVGRATDRPSTLGLPTRTENDTTCCYARQDKVWVHGPGAEPWEVYTVTADAPEARSIHLGHDDMRAALIYQRATSSADRRIADGLSGLVDDHRRGATRSPDDERDPPVAG